MQNSPTISDWVIAEFSAALSVKLRRRDITPGDRAAALGKFTELIDGSFGIFAVSSSHFRMAAQFADQYATGLRAGDALHLAICASHGATLCTLDKRLLEAGPVLGVKTLLP
jgi:predicted nucleic acid-binding protein